MSETGAPLMIYHLHVEKYFCLLCQFWAFIFLTVIFLLFPLCVWMDGGSHSCRWWSSWSDRLSFLHFREGVWHFILKTSSVCPWCGSSRGRRSWSHRWLRGTDILCVSQGIVSRRASSKKNDISRLSGRLHTPLCYTLTLTSRVGKQMR